MYNSLKNSPANIVESYSAGLITIQIPKKF